LAEDDEEDRMSDRIERELSLPAPAQEVWDAVTGDGWLADEVELVLEPGGDARFRSEDLLKTGWVEHASEPSRLAFWWAADGEPATRVELTLDEVEDERTRLRVVETRPLDALDLIATPLDGRGGRSYGPVLIAA
jgi:uncharacterized protein YndB with AHSA1/START domain